MRFRAIYGNGILGVAFGYGLNLVDPDGLARPDMVYLFRNGNSSGCSVLATPNRDPMLLDLLNRPQR